MGLVTAGWPFDTPLLLATISGQGVAVAAALVSWVLGQECVWQAQARGTMLAG